MSRSCRVDQRPCPSVSFHPQFFFLKPPPPCTWIPHLTALRPGGGRFSCRFEIPATPPSSTSLRRSPLACLLILLPPILQSFPLAGRPPSPCSPPNLKSKLPFLLPYSIDLYCNGRLADGRRGWRIRTITDCVCCCALLGRCARVALPPSTLSVLYCTSGIKLLEAMASAAASVFPSPAAV
ncbi:uncharacterized protein IWZ02DRAFT_24147 [Phyllosticta citriasiana]|uniref:uncharacterized protein n=1 Tax=Phyllosticta citriasiana TaxID=595635 RepID=UPI0030FD4B23